MCIDGALAWICGLVLIRATEEGLRRAETTIVVGRDVYMIGKAFVRRSSDSCVDEVHPHRQTSGA